MEKKMRELSDEEKGFAQKVIDGRISEKKHVDLMIRYNEFMINEMLESNYLEKKREFKRQTENLKNELIELDKVINVTEKQIVDGVEIKEEIVESNEAPTMVD